MISIEILKELLLYALMGIALAIAVVYALMRRRQAQSYRETKNPDNQSMTEQEPRREMSREWQKRMKPDNPTQESNDEFSVNHPLSPQPPQASTQHSNREKLTALETVVLKGIQDGSIEIELKPVEGRKKKGVIKLFGNSFNATMHTKQRQQEKPFELPVEKDPDAIPEQKGDQ